MSAQSHHPYHGGLPLGIEPLPLDEPHPGPPSKGLHPLVTHPAVVGSTSWLTHLKLHRVWEQSVS